MRKEFCAILFRFSDASICFFRVSYLKQIDKQGQYIVSSYVTAGRILANATIFASLFHMPFLRFIPLIFP